MVRGFLFLFFSHKYSLSICFSRYDVHDKKLISGDFEECGMTHFIRGLDVDVPERRINLKFGKNDKTLGFNVRGGKEYGLGIYVSKYEYICSNTSLLTIRAYFI